MFQTLKNAWNIIDLRKKILFTIGLLLVFRLGSYIPVPSLDRTFMEKLMSNDILGYLNNITGGGLMNLSLFAMSITPYINASIIMQLLTIAIPKLEKLSKEGEEGRKIIAKYIRYGTVVLGLVQAIGLYLALAAGKAVFNPSLLTGITVVLTFTAGTAFLMWLGEQITEFGIGNGISLLIFAGIISRIPSAGYFLYQQGQVDWKSYLIIIPLLAAMFVVIALVVLFQQAERRIPVQYAKRVVGRKMYGGQSTHIPIKVAMAGVIPIIFAMSIMMFPSQIMKFVIHSPNRFWTTLIGLLSPSSWVFAVFEALLIIGFTYFYTFVTFNPVEVANTLKKNGGFIPGIRTGKPTADYIKNVLNRITIVGALFLASITILPYIIQGITKFGNNIYFGGTALLIVVGVALDTVKQLESQMLMRHYKGFLE